MLYLQGLSNLQVGNVANYLDPIVSNGEENQDIKFLAAWTTLSVAQDRAERVLKLNTFLNRINSKINSLSTDL